MSNYSLYGITNYQQHMHGEPGHVSDLPRPSDRSI